MAAPSRTRLVNPRLGTYFSTFASAFTAIVLIALILEQLGVSDETLRWAMLLCPLALYALIGVGSATSDPAEFFVSGRRVPAFFSGLVLALAACGGTGLVAVTGLMFLNGFDAWCVVAGFSAGLVMMAVLIAPYFRKLGTYTVPSFLGRRLESRTVRVTAAAVLAVPLILIIVAEIQIAAFAAGMLTGEPTMVVAGLIAAAIIVTVAPGGMRSATWSGTAQSIAALLALIVPVGIVAAVVTNLPLPQFSYGPVLRGIGRFEQLQGVPVPVAGALAFDLAGIGLEPIVQRLATPFANVGPLSFILASLTIMAGVAAAPWLVPRAGVTPGVYDARKSLGWAMFLYGTAMLTASAVAVFFRDIAMDELVGRSASQLPLWFKDLAQQGLADVRGNMPQLPLTSFSFKRDAVLFALPVAAGHPAVVLYLALIGAVAAALVAASAGIVSLSHLLTDDAIGGLDWNPMPAGMRLVAARLAIATIAIATAWLAVAVPADPITLLLWALALSGSTAFPVLVASIWWKRLTATGAVAGLIAGFAVVILAITAGETMLGGLDSRLAGVFGIPAAVAAGVLVSLVTPKPARPVLERVREMRVPGGETVYDREQRILRLRSRERP